MNMKNKKYLSEDEIAKIIDISPITLQRWKYQGKIPFKMIKQKTYFKKSEIIEWAKEHDFAIQLNPDKKSRISKDEHFLSEAIQSGGIYYNIAGANVYSVLDNALKKIDFLDHMQHDVVLNELINREELASTGIGKGIALPHSRSRIDHNLTKSHVAVFFLEQDIDYNALDDKPVFVLFMLFSASTKEHLKLLSRISFALKNSGILSILNEKNKNNNLIETIRKINEVS